MTFTLPTAVYGDDLIPGSAESVFTDSQTFADAATKVETARIFVRFRKLSDEWTGGAGDSYRNHLESIETSLTFAIDAFTAASNALFDYGLILSWAQTQAAGLIAAYWTETAVSPTALNPNPSPYTMRTDALNDLPGLRSEVRQAASYAAVELQRAVRDAPYDPTFWNRLGWGASRFVRAGEDEIIDNSRDIDWLTSGEGTTAEKFTIVTTGMRNQFSDPKQLLKDIVGWDQLGSDPMAWMGSAGLETATGLGTGGLSMALLPARRAWVDALLPDRSLLRPVLLAPQTGRRTSWQGIDFAPVTRYETPGRSVLTTGESGAPLVIETAFGTTRLNPDLRTLFPNATYVVGPAVYETDQFGDVRRLIVDEVQVAAGRRSQYTQSQVGQLGGAGYDGGHLLAAAHGGGGERGVMAPMLTTLNQAVKGYENFYWVEGDVRAMAGSRGPAPSFEVNVDKLPGMEVPQGFDVKWGLPGDINGTYLENFE